MKRTDVERAQRMDKFRHNLRAQASKVYLVLEEHKKARVTDEELVIHMRSLAQGILLQCQLFEDLDQGIPPCV